MEDLLEKVIQETTDQEVKMIAQSIKSLDLSAEEMEANLITSELVSPNQDHDKED